MPTHRSGRSRRRDDHAAALIEQLCVAKAWGAADLARETNRIARDRQDPRLCVSRKTIDRILLEGTIPQARVKCGIALALNVAPWQLWGPGAMPLAHQAQVYPVAVAA